MTLKHMDSQHMTQYKWTFVNLFTKNTVAKSSTFLLVHSWSATSPNLGIRLMNSIGVWVDAHMVLAKVSVINAAGVKQVRAVIECLRQQMRELID